MSRRPIELPSQVTAEIEARTARGESAETIKAAIPKAPSARTLRRHQARLRAPGGAKPAAPPAPAPAPVTPAPPVEAFQHGPGWPVLRAYETAPDDVTAAKRLLALVVLHEPEIGEAIAGGAALVDA